MFSGKAGGRPQEKKSDEQEACLQGCSGLFAGIVVFGIPRRLLYGNRHLAFGPFLIVAGVFVYLWPDAVDFALKWYMGLFVG